MGRHFLHRLFAAVGLAVALVGCASVPSTTSYRITSNVQDVDIYKGASPDSLEFYVKGPYFDLATTSKGWSYGFFQARKAGYLNSRVIQQPVSAWGTPVHIHFDLERDTPKGTHADLAPYAARNTVDAYSEFLVLYPGTPIRGEVNARIVVLLAGRSDRDEQIRGFLKRDSIFLDALPMNDRLAWTGPDNLMVRDLQQLLRDGIGVAILEQKVLASRGVYRDFSLDELRALKQMKVDDRLVAAMLKSSNDNRKAVPAAVAARSEAPQVVARVAPVAKEEDSMPAECLKLAAAVKACDQAGGFLAMACKMGAESQFKCPLPMSQILR